jgi:hypothetical protein
VKPPAIRLLLTAVLFAGWLGYLTYLVLCRPHAPGGLVGAFEGRPVTLSRPQFLVSMLDVVAKLEDEKGETIVIKEVLYPKEGAAVQTGQTIRVENIKDCRPLPDPESKASPPPDYTGPGEYLLPLQFHEKNGKKRFEVVPIPPSPGFPPQHNDSAGPPRIYPYNESIEAEYRQIAK